MQRLTKVSLIFALLIGLCFAAVDVPSTTSSNFYTKLAGTSTPYWVSTGLTFNSHFVLSTTAKILSPSSASKSDLPNGAVICPGVVTAATSVTGTYAAGSWSVRTFADNPLSSVQNDPATYTNWNGAFTPNLGIQISKSTYDSLNVINSDGDAYQGSADYNAWNTQYSQKLDLLDLYINYKTVTFNNKAGRVAMVCNSRINHTLNGANKGSAYLDGSAFSTSTAYLSSGTHTYSSTMNMVGCAIIVEPTGPAAHNDGYKFLYSRTSPNNGPEYSYVQASTQPISFTVKNPTFSATTARYFPADTLLIPSSSSMPVYIRVTNTGTVKLRVTQVSLGSPSTAGFTVTPITTATVMDPLHVGTTIQNMYNRDISPGSSGIVAVNVNSPATVPKNSNVKINLKIEATELTCTGLPAGQTFEYTNKTDDVPVNPPVDVTSCDFKPSTANALPGETLQYNLTCYNDTNSVIPCTGANALDISVEPSTYALLAQTPYQIAGPKTAVRVRAVAEGYSFIIASLDGSAMCVASIDIYPGDQAQSCQYVPSSGTVNALEPWTYQLKCYNKPLSDSTKVQVPCKDTTGFSENVAPAILAQSHYPAPDGVSTIFVPAAPGTITFTAGSSSVVHPFSCSATLNAMDVDFTSCSLDPTRFDTSYLDQFGLFTLTCYKNGAQVACPFDPNKVYINVTNNIAAPYDYHQLIDGDKRALVIVSTTAYGQGVLTVRDKATGASCTAIVNVTPSSNNLNTCAINPNFVLANISNTKLFRINCTELGSDVLCPNVVWSLTGAAATITSSTNAAARVRYSAVGTSTLSATVTTPNGLPKTYTCSATAQVASGVLGDTCIVIPNLNSSLATGSNQRFNVSCYDTTTLPGSHIKVPCLDVAWSTTVVNATYAPPTGNYTIAHFPSVGVGRITATVGASVPSARYACYQSITVQAPSSPEFGDACNITGPTTIKENTLFGLSLNCFNSTTNNPANCTGAVWNLSNVNGGAIDGDDHGALCFLNQTNVIQVLLNGGTKDGCSLNINVTHIPDGNDSNETNDSGVDLGANGLCADIVVTTGVAPDGSAIWRLEAFCGDTSNPVSCANVDWSNADGSPIPGLSSQNPVFISTAMFNGADAMKIRAVANNGVCSDEPELKISYLCRNYI